MINSITYNNIIINLRNKLIEQTQLTSNRVLNSISIRGTDLSEVMNQTTSVSFELCKAFMLFEMLEKEDQENNVVIENETNESIDSISTFDFNLKIYGDDCHIVAQNILTRFKTAEVAGDLRDKGIYIYGITFPTTINEFINNTMWQRCDMTIKIRVRFNITKISTTPDAESVHIETATYF